ncbi:hypothetical protein [Mycolicibacterium canariasense]|uniref:hypothetical protein n=3 Tax=Mycolicibacterium canariasense TaxID=228230 RepID=UPI000A8030F6|nr:hypothetical protein [Mycolicibacterium canariasense]MCV7212926.1 hypothetical protein [Mycolicibacterium canariasense]
MRARPLKRFHRVALIVLLALGAPGCGPGPAAPAPATLDAPAPAVLGLGSAERINAWRKQHYEAFKTLGTASGRLAMAINRADFDGIHTICRDLTIANQQIRTSLPTPDQALTTALRQMTGQLNELTTRCPTLSFRSSTGEFIQFGAEVKGAARSFEAARAILRSAERR